MQRQLSQQRDLLHTDPYLDMVLRSEKKSESQITESRMGFVRGWEVEEMGEAAKRVQTSCEMNVLGHGVLRRIK